MTIPSERLDTELFEVMESKLTALVTAYRRTNDQQVVTQYRTLLRCMLELGFTAPLDVDIELPDEMMPAEYLRLHRPGKL